MMSKYLVIPERSRVQVLIASTLHPVEGNGVGLEGFVDVKVRDGVVDLAAPPVGELSFAIAKLRSENRLFDSEMMRRVGARRHPVVRGSLCTVTQLDTDHYRLKGELTFHGVTRSVDGEADVRLRGDFIDAEGELTLDIRDFDLTPPKLLMLKVDPEVSIRLSVTARLVTDEGS